MNKRQQLMFIFFGMVTESKNDWKSKEREIFATQAILKLDWVKDGTKIFRKNKKLNKKLKNHYFNWENDAITSKGYEHDYYFIHEPFGPNCSPDYLFITPYGFFGIEDKATKEGTIAFNTGTPGENKIIIYTDTKEKMVYPTHGSAWGWTKKHKEALMRTDARLKEVANVIFQEEMEKDGLWEGPIKKFSFYMRRMLVDGNMVKDIYDPELKEVNSILDFYLR